MYRNIDYLDYLYIHKACYISPEIGGTMKWVLICIKTNIIIPSQLLKSLGFGLPGINIIIIVSLLKNNIFFFILHIYLIHEENN